MPFAANAKTASVSKLKELGLKKNMLPEAGKQITKLRLDVKKDWPARCSRTDLQQRRQPRGRCTRRGRGHSGTGGPKHSKEMLRLRVLNWPRRWQCVFAKSSRVLIFILIKT